MFRKYYLRERIVGILTSLPLEVFVGYLMLPEHVLFSGESRNEDYYKRPSDSQRLVKLFTDGFKCPIDQTSLDIVVPTNAKLIHKVNWLSLDQIKRPRAITSRARQSCIGPQVRHPKVTGLMVIMDKSAMGDLRSHSSSKLR